MKEQSGGIPVSVYIAKRVDRLILINTFFM